MLKKKISYTDYNGEFVEETHYFNLSKVELIEMEVVGHESGSFSGWMQTIVEADERGKLFTEFKKLILASYGKKSEDGKSFIKNDELSNAFAQTIAFDTLFMELATVENASVEFIRGIVPPDLAAALPEAPKGGIPAPPTPPVL